MDSNRAEPEPSAARGRRGLTKPLLAAVVTAVFVGDLAALTFRRAERRQQAAPIPTLSPGPGSPGSPAPTSSPDALPAPTAGPRIVSTEGDPQAMPPTRPPAEGTYRYRVTTVTSGEDRQDRTSVRDVEIIVETTAQNPVRQSFTTLRESGATSFQQNVIWLGDGLVTDGFASSDGGFAYECDWEPDLLDHRLPHSMGLAWRVDSSCRTSAGDFREVERSTVASAGVVEIEGRTVRTWIVQRGTSETRSLPQGSFTRETDSEEMFSPEHGIVVRSQRESTSQSPDGTQTKTSQTLELLTLTPGPA
ncbi:MAG: hypothetical protein ACRDI1_01375 [Actinomycetota bacterium]